MDLSIDVVIPSFRVIESILLRIVNLDKPLNFVVEFYIIIDNPNIEVPESLIKLSDSGKIHLVINSINLGFSETRNKGIRLGKSSWVLLLDDDIVPQSDLLKRYSEKIIQHPDALGFAGTTCFPIPFNYATKALKLNGSVDQFTAAERQDTLMWAPTANIVLQRSYLDPDLFNPVLKKGGEDIEFLIRNALLSGKTYISVPEARVEHPWWDEGRIQVARMFRYGKGSAQIADLPVINKYTYYDFTNTSETVFLLLLFLPFSTIIFPSYYTGLQIILLYILCDFIVNYIRSVYLSKSLSPALGIHVFLIKNAYELGALVYLFEKGLIRGFARRIDMGFSKSNPSWFRLNKWKIVKTILIILFLTLLYKSSTPNLHLTTLYFTTSRYLL